MLLLLVGGGFVGTVSAVVFAEQGHDVLLLEADEDRRRALAQGTPHFEEPGVADALRAQLSRRRLQVIGDLSGLERRCDVAFLCVGTPRAADGSADLEQVRAAAAQVAPHTRILCVKSTVPPGTLEEVVAPALPEGIRPLLASVPEFLAEGTALGDARAPGRVVVGTRSDDAAKVLETLHAPLGGTIVTTTPRSAEMAKYASNAMLAARVGIVNELANLSQDVGASVQDVLRVVGLDPRIGGRFLEPGLGFGGSCFPKDVTALCTLGRRRGNPLPILETVVQENERQPLRTMALLQQALGDLSGRRIAMLGVAFKPGTSDVRESRPLVLAEALRAQGATVVAHDPHARGPGWLVMCADLAEALAGADACVLATPWPEYIDADWEPLLASMRQRVMIDPWRKVSHLRRSTRYFAIGEPHHESSDPRSGARDQVPALHQERA